MHNPHAYILCKSFTYVCVVCVRCFNFSVTGQRSNAVTRSYCGWLGANFARFKADYSTVRQYAQLAFPITGKLEWIGTIICGGPVNRQTVMFPQVLLGVEFPCNWVSTWQLLRRMISLLQLLHAAYLVDSMNDMTTTLFSLLCPGINQILQDDSACPFFLCLQSPSKTTYSDITVAKNVHWPL